MKTKPAQMKAKPAKRMLNNVDRYGDALPRHAILRLGTNRLRPNFPTMSGALGWSGDGKLLAVGGWAPKLFVYDAFTGEARAKLALGSEAKARQVALSHDGSRLAALETRTRGILVLRLFDVMAGTPIQFETAHADTIAFSPDGTLLAGTNRGAHPIFVYDARSGARTHTIDSRGGGGSGDGIAFSQDNSLLLTVQRWDGYGVILWDLKRQRAICECKLEGEDPVFDAVAVALTDRRMIASAAGRTFVWDLEGQLVDKLGADPASSSWRALTPDGALLAAFDRETDEVVVRRGTDGAELGRAPAYATGSALASDGTLATMTGYTVRIWERETLAERSAAIAGLEFSPNSLGFAGVEIFTTTTYRDGLRRFSAVDGSALPSAPGDAEIRTARLDERGRYALSLGPATGDDTKRRSMSLYDAGAAKRLATLSCAAPVSAWTFSPDAGRAAIAEGTHISVISIPDVELVRRIDSAGMHGLCFSKDGGVLAAVGRAAHVWDLATGAHAEVVVKGACGHLALSGDGRLLIVPAGRSIELLEVSFGKDQLGLRVLHSVKWGKRPLGAALHPNDKWFAVVDISGTSVCDVTTGEVLARLPGQTSCERARSAIECGGPWFSPDGSRLYTYDAFAVLAWELMPLLGRSGIPLARQARPDEPRSRSISLRRAIEATRTEA